MNPHPGTVTRKTRSSYVIAPSRGPGMVSSNSSFVIPIRETDSKSRVGNRRPDDHRDRATECDAVTERKRRLTFLGRSTVETELDVSAAYSITKNRASSHTRPAGVRRSTRGHLSQTMPGQGDSQTGERLVQNRSTPTHKPNTAISKQNLVVMRSLSRQRPLRGMDTQEYSAKLADARNEVSDRRPARTAPSRRLVRGRAVLASGRLRPRPKSRRVSRPRRRDGTERRP